MYDIKTGQWDLTDKLQRLIAEKKSANELQERRHNDWNENYELYRNKVKTNRLTQRQAVNIPLMKETVKTILSKIDDSPQVSWKEKGGDENKEILFKEIWEANLKENKLELVDILDKKNVLLYGLSTRRLNLSETGVGVEVLDPFDVTFDPLMKIGNIESARFIVHQNIFRSVREILADDRYTREGKEQLKIWLDSAPGITQSEESKKKWEEKMERLKSMGVEHKDFGLFAGGDRIINLTEHFTTSWNDKKKDWERRVVVYADNSIELLDEPIKELLGVDFWPFVVWAEDPETSDIYPDSVGDLVRTPNKVLNVWFSQLIENRTLKNFQMHWFLPSQGYTPQTYTPGAGVMLPAPPGEDINKVIKPVEISGLDDTMLAISSLTQIVERASGATAIEKGQPEKGTQTLGEVEILVGKAMERSVGMAKFYRLAWYELASKWEEIIHANAPKVLTLYKTGRSGKMYTKKVLASDWKSDLGYEPTVESTSEQEQNDIKNLQKWSLVKAQFPDNPAVQKISAKRLLGILDVSPDELKEIEQAEKQKVSGIPAGPSAPTPSSPMMDNSGLLSEIQDSLTALST